MRPSTRRAAAAAVLGGALLLLHALWYAFGWGGERGMTVAGDVILVVVPLLAAACIADAARRGPARSRRRHSFAWLAAGVASWGLGQVAWTWYEVVVGVEVPFPSIADIGYLAFFPFAAVALLVAMPPGATSALRLRTLLDGLVAASWILFALWALLIGELYETSGVPLLEKAIGLAYPLGDVVLLTVVVVTARGGGAEARGSVALLAAGVVALALADSGFAYLTLTEQYQTGNPIDLAWTLGFVLLGLGAAWPRAPLGPPREEGVSFMDVHLPFVPVLVGLAVGAYHFLVAPTPSRILLWNGVMAAFFLTCRQLVALDDLWQTNRRLRESKEARDLALSKVVHDLGTPLTSVRIQVHLLAREVDGEAVRRVALVEKGVAQLSHLVDDVRDVTHIEQGRLRVRKTSLDLADATRAVVEAMTPQAAARGVALVVGEAPTATVLADAQRVAQVVTNLVSNAIKFTPAGGTVRVSLETGGGEARVRVRDTGPGLTASERAALFRPFVRVHEDRPGTGLGLFICKGIVEEHGGRVFVASEGPGRGSEFGFALPLAAGAAEERAALADVATGAATG